MFSLQRYKPWLPLVFTSLLSLVSALVFQLDAHALGESSEVEVRGVEVDGVSESRPSARHRIAWEARKRTTIDTRLRPRSSRLDAPDLHESPLLFWTGDQAFSRLSDAEIRGLRRFLEFGGMLVIDAQGDTDFAQAARRAVLRALPGRSFAPLRSDHTIYHSFYMIDRPVGRVRGAPQVDAIELDGRLAVLASSHDLAGAWERDDLGNWLHSVEPGGEAQREQSIRFGVNLVMYALCLDYKDDQVHAPFIMRRRPGSTPVP